MSDVLDSCRYIRKRIASLPPVQQAQIEEELRRVQQAISCIRSYLDDLETSLSSADGALVAHVVRTDNPHSVTHAQLPDTGSNTHAQIDIAISDSASHIANTSNPHSVTHAQLPDNGTNTHAQIDTAVADSVSHIANTSNPHTVTHAQLSDKGTNTHAEIDTAISNSVSHIVNTSNPHGVTHAQLSDGGTLSHATIDTRLGWTRTFPNLITDSQLIHLGVTWEAVAVGSNVTASLLHLPSNAISLPDQPDGTRCAVLRVNVSSVGSVGTSYGGAISRKFTCTPNSHWQIAVYVRAGLSATQGRVIARFYDASDTIIFGGSFQSTLTSGLNDAGTDRTLDEFSRLFAVGQAPANAATFRLEVSCLPAQTGNVDLAIVFPLLAQADGSETGGAPWSFGPIRDIGNWNDYTPAWTSTATAPAIGNGSIEGKWRTRGTEIEYFIWIKMGSTTTYGTGYWQFGLPSGHALNTAELSDTSLNVLGVAACYDGANVDTEAVLQYSTSTTLICVGSPSGLAAACVPFTWASNDRIVLRFTAPVIVT